MIVTGRRRLIQRWPYALLASAVALVASVTLQLVTWSPAGAVSGDTVLAGYVAAYPPTVHGVQWVTAKQSVEQPLATTLKANLQKQAAGGARTNVAVSSWVTPNRRFGLEIILVSSSSLQKIGFADPLRTLSDYCSAQQGQANGSAMHIHGVPGGALALCTYPAQSGLRGAALAAFVRGNVAGLVVFTSKGKAPSPTFVSEIALYQYQIVPAHNVLVTSGFDVGIIVVWVMILALVVGGVIACVRRRKTWWGPYDAIVDALVRRRLALGISLLVVVGGMAFSLLANSLAYIHGGGGWLESQSNDGWISWRAATLATAGGGFGHLYQFDPILQTAPGWEVVAAPFARMASGLSHPIPFIVLKPTAWLVAGPLFLATIVLPLCAGDRWLQEMGTTAVSRRVFVLAAMALTLVPLALYGHPEDIVTLGAMLYGLHAASRGRRAATGWWLGVALAFQFLGLIAVPLAIALLLRKRRLSTARDWLELALPIIGLPLLVLFVPLVSDPSGTVNPLVHQHVSDFFGYVSPIWHLGGGVAVIVRMGVPLIAIPAAIVIAKVRKKDAGWVATYAVWLLAVVLMMRLFEPALLPYYVGPPLTLFVLSAGRGPRWRMLLSTAIAIWLTWWVHFAIHERWGTWLLLVAQYSALALLAAPFWVRGPAAGAQSSDSTAATDELARSSANKGSQQAAKKTSVRTRQDQDLRQKNTRQRLPSRKGSS